MARKTRREQIATMCLWDDYSGVLDHLPERGEDVVYYHCIGKGDTCESIYVGVTSDFVRRQLTHLNGPWGREITHFHIVRGLDRPFESRKEAEAHEWFEILNLRPRYNQVGAR
jgi:predicted GIY-YIG superfamily endonuclease